MVFAFGEFEADERLCQLRRAGERVHVEPRAFDLLVYLIRHRDRVVPKAELLETVWRGLRVSDSSLSTCMNSLRRALSVPQGTANPIETLRARGYRFVASVEERRRGERPGGGAASAEDPFVGRQAILASLERALAEARGGSTRIVALAGEAGIGKTRTAEQLAVSARAHDVQVLTTRCPQDSGEPPFWAWIAILRPLAEALGPVRLRALLGRGLGPLGLLLPELDATPPSGLVSESGSDRYRLFDAVTRLLASRAGDVPLLVVIEDLQWADAASLELLEHVASEVRESPLLLLCTTRDSSDAGPTAGRRTLAELARLPSFQRIQIQELSEVEVAAYLAAASGETPSPACVRVLRERTDGNPLFLRELVRLLLRTGAPLEASPRAVLPPSLRDVIVQRLLGLSARTLELLRLACVIGRDFDVRLLGEALDAPAEALLDALDEASAAGVVREVPERPGGMRFSHALVRDALYEELAPGERVRAHERVARALEKLRGSDLEGPLGELAYHWRAAAPGGHAERALEYSLRAVAQARRRTAYEDAALQYEHALTALDGTPPGRGEHRLELLLGLGEAWLLAGDAQRTRERFAEAAQLARRLGRAEDLVRAALGYGGSALWGNAPDAGERTLLEEAQSRLGEGAPALRAQLAARLATIRSYGGDLEAQRAPARDALELARISQQPEVVGEALHALHFVLRGPDHLDEREALARELLGLGVREQHTFAIREAAAADRLSRGDRAGFEEMLDEAGRMARESHHPALRWLATANAASAALLDGRFGDAERGMQEAAELGRRARNPQALPLAIGQTFALRRERGALSELERPFEAIGGNLDWIGSYPQAMLAVLRAELGRMDAARTVFERVVDGGLAKGPRREDWLVTATELAGVAARLCDRDRARVLYDALSPYRDRFAVYPGTLLSAGPVARALGLLARTLDRRASAAAHFEAALATCEALGALPARLRCAKDLGLLLLDSDAPVERDRARRLLAEAHECARSLGMAL